ncbi:MAG: hypothetical protein JO032_05910 [Alphaproteobacteria bacterium]|nr:hypothetical protein [Alphaproteobacteria bacterium]
MILKFAAGAAVALALAGSGILQSEEKLPAAAPEATGVELTKQQGGRFIAFTGQRLQHTQPFLGVEDTNYFLLRSWLDNKTGETAHQLYVADSYFGAPIKWNGVHDRDNKPLRFVAISRNEISCESGCSYADEFGAALPEDYLRAHREGFSVVFTADGGKSFPIAVPANLVAAELAAVDTVRAVAAKAAPASVVSPAAAPAPATPAPKAQ